MARKRSRKTKNVKESKCIGSPEESETNRVGLIRFIARWLELIELKEANNRATTPPSTIVRLPLSKRRAQAPIKNDPSINGSPRASIEDNMECNSGNDMAVSTEKPCVLDTPSIEGSQLESFNDLSWTNDTSKEESWFDSIITSDYGGSDQDFCDFK